MTRLFVDIETIPGESKINEYIKKHSKLPENVKTPSEIEQWLKDEYKKTSLDGDFGRIICIGLILDPPNKETNVLTGPEPEILKSFWEYAQKADLFIAHNGFDFDFPFIYKRSCLNQIKPSRQINFARYRNDQIYDTMQEWNKWTFNKRISFDKLAYILNLPSSKIQMDGSKVYDYYIDGKLTEIYDYCKRDVELLRKIYLKMTFQE